MSSENKPKYLKKKSESQMRLATNKSNLNNANKTNNVNPLPPPVTPSNALQLQLYDSAKFTHRFVIQNGRARVDLPDYITFKQSFSLRWGSIITIIKYLEDLCQTYSISVGFIDGLK
jgi:ABC-type Fe3+-citrate transport system substrate-binding protein